MSEPLSEKPIPYSRCPRCGRGEFFWWSVKREKVVCEYCQDDDDQYGDEEPWADAEREEK